MWQDDPDKVYPPQNPEQGTEDLTIGQLSQICLYKYIYTYIYICNYAVKRLNFITK